MKSLDYFYEEILMPICSVVVDIVSDFAFIILNGLLTLVYFITIPLWIIPYLIIRHKRNKRRSTEYVSQKGYFERLLEIDERIQHNNKILTELEKKNTEDHHDSD